VSSSYNIREVDLEEWDRLIQPFPARTVFHGSPWLRAVRDGYRIPVRTFVAEARGEVRAAWPLMDMRRGPFRISGSPLPGTSTPYLGPLFADLCDVSVAMQTFLQDQRIGRYAHAFWRVLDRHRLVYLGFHGFTAMRAFETYLLDLRRSEEELWDGLTRSCRNRIRKAQSSGLEVKRESEAEFVDELWPLAVEVFARKGIHPNFSQSFLREMWTNLREAKQIAAYSACSEGRRIAFLLIPFDAHTAYYWAGGAASVFEAFAPNNLLHWQAILDARERGLATYDFVSTKGGPGRFKATFGPKAVTVCTHWEHSRSWLTSLARRAYERMVRARRRLASPPGEADDE
jgi:CelD/BcsL family acetyltransferase involved in cellulose biosynthesis